MEEFEVKGLWWIPQFPNHRVAGTLKFHPHHGAVLETLGDNFLDPITQMFGIANQPTEGATTIPENITIETICGYTNHGDPVTLWKCYNRQDTWAIGYVGGVVE